MTRRICFGTKRDGTGSIRLFSFCADIFAPVSTLRISVQNLLRQLLRISLPRCLELQGTIFFLSAREYACFGPLCCSAVCFRLAVSSGNPSSTIYRVTLATKLHWLACTIYSSACVCSFAGSWDAAAAEARDLYKLRVYIKPTIHQQSNTTYMNQHQTSLPHSNGEREHAPNGVTATEQIKSSTLRSSQERRASTGINTQATFIHATGGGKRKDRQNTERLRRHTPFSCRPGQVPLEGSQQTRCCRPDVTCSEMIFVAP